MPFDFAAQDISDHGFPLASRCGHGRKVLFSHEMPGCRAHGFRIQRVPEMVHVPLDQALNGSVRSVVDSKLVELAGSASCCVEFGAHVTYVANGHVFLKPRAKRVQESVTRQFTAGPKIADLSGGMDPGIRPTASDQFHGMTDRPLNDLFQNTLHRALPGLGLPPVEVGTVISHLQANIPMHELMVLAGSDQWKRVES